MTVTELGERESLISHAKKGSPQRDFQMLAAWWKRRKQSRVMVDAAAAALISEFGDQAYYIARQRASECRQRHTIDANREEGHWARVRAEIGRRTGRNGVDTATRYLQDNP